MHGTAQKRNSVLNDRHRALGSDLLSSWNDMPIPQDYSACPYDEVETVRNRAGLFDVSALKIVNVDGPDATRFLNHVLTTDVTKAKPGGSHISNIVDESGALIDDVLVYVDGDGRYRVSHGGGGFEEAAAAAKGNFDVIIARDDDVHILSLQGPLALETLAPHTGSALADLPYFQHQKTTLFGRSVSIARGGYSAERGYEVFCSSADAPFLWDSIVEAGKGRGVTPVSWSCLDIIRVEGGLLFFPFDMTHGDTTPWEVRADWSVDLSKVDFIGKRALIDKKGKERSFITGLEVWHHDALPPLATVYADGKEVGVLTSTAFSQHLMKSLAMAQIEPAHTRLGTELTVHDKGKDYQATVVRMPFYDPMRLRTHPAS